MAEHTNESGIYNKCHSYREIKVGDRQWMHVCMGSRGYPLTDRKIEANIRFMAAARDMEAALENAVGLLRTYGENVGCIEQCDAALAKARGNATKGGGDG